MTKEKINQANSYLLQQLSLFLNYHSNLIQEILMKEMMSDSHLTVTEAYSFLLAQILGLDIAESTNDMELYYHYFPSMIHMLKADEYRKNPYYEQILIPELSLGDWQLTHLSYKPYEGFVMNDFRVQMDGSVIPQIGFFEELFSYPAVLYQGLEWMTITPNEIETMKASIQKAEGNVLTYGLGLGYYTYMVSEKDSVSSITVVEKDPDIIHLFKDYLLPQFSQKDKIILIQQDAFEYAKQQHIHTDFDFVFTDLWHDASDGIPLYKEMKQLENIESGCCYAYWIEPTMQYYLS